MTKRKSNEQFVRELHVVRPDLIPMEEYPKNNHTKMKIQCRICSYEWETTPFSLLHNKMADGYNGCPNCTNHIRSVLKKKSNDDFLSELNIVNSMIKPLEPYQYSDQKILCKCLTCGYEWMGLPAHLLSGHGCPKCGYESVRKQLCYTKEEYVAKLQEVNSDVILVGDYVNSQTHTTFMCKKCLNTWQAVPGSLLRGSGCPHCKDSRGEKRIKQYLKINNIEFESQKKFPNCSYKYVLKFDFYLPTYNLCIEYDGIQHFQPIDHFGGEVGFKEVQIKDQIKNCYCKSNNINLLRIPYTEYNNIENIIQEKLYMYNMAKV